MMVELDQGSIHVAQYLTKLPPKQLLEKNAFANVKTTETKIDLYDAGGVISWKDQIKGKV